MTRAQFDEYIINSPMRRLAVAVKNLHRTPGGMYTRRCPIEDAEDGDVDRLWNGEAYACDRCPATFRLHGSALAHLRSPVHDALIYKCKDTGDHEGCGQTFSTLGALLQHVNHGRCHLAYHDAEGIAECLDNILHG